MCSPTRTPGKKNNFLEKVGSNPIVGMGQNLDHFLEKVGSNPIVGKYLNFFGKGRFESNRAQIFNFLETVVTHPLPCQYPFWPGKIFLERSSFLADTNSGPTWSELSGRQDDSDPSNEPNDLVLQDYSGSQTKKQQKYEEIIKMFTYFKSRCPGQEIPLVRFL